MSDTREQTFVASLLRSEAIGGAIALVAAATAVLWANLDVAGYHAVQHHRFGPLDVEAWAADGALTLFFFLAGLELKREFLVGSLRDRRAAAVPIVAACTGVAVPALIYLAVNAVHPDGAGNLGGWAIPAATDIAFALAVLSLVGTALPQAVRAFLLTLAVVDDFVVIVIIAIAYTSGLDWVALLGAAVLLAAYGSCQRWRVHTPLLLLPLAVGSWWLVHESGVHATVAGVVLGLLTRVRPDAEEDCSPAENIERRLGPLSSAVAVPFFALMSAGVSLAGGPHLGDPIVLGVLLGLVLGKPVGILGGSWLVTRFTSAGLGELRWPDLVGVAVLGGVGFTVSLLVSDLSFTGVRAEEAKTAVLMASVIASILGAGVLLGRNRRHRRG